MPEKLQSSAGVMHSVGNYKKLITANSRYSATTDCHAEI